MEEKDRLQKLEDSLADEETALEKIRDSLKGEIQYLHSQQR
jgi:hypothetical protein